MPTPFIDKVITEYRRTRSPYRTAKILNIPVDEVWSIVEEHKDHRPEHSDGWGRPDIRQYTVARRRAGGVWNNMLPKIAEARQNFEAGFIDLATGRDGGWEILYALPRKKRKPRPNYFELKS